MENDKLVPADITADDADGLAELIDRLMAGGTQHIDIETGDQTRVRTVNSTECGRVGPCAAQVPGEDDDQN